jgi:hybrid cluster-associated redox disulfide protein
LFQHKDREQRSAQGADGASAKGKGIMRGPKIDDPDLPLRLLFDHWPQTAEVFLAHRMACFGCPIAPFHTVIDACAEYRLDEPTFRAELRAAVGARPDAAA